MIFQKSVQNGNAGGNKDVLVRLLGWCVCELDWQERRLEPAFEGFHLGCVDAKRLLFCWFKGLKLIFGRFWNKR